MRLLRDVTFWVEMQPCEVNSVSKGRQIPKIALAVSVSCLIMSLGRGSKERERERQIRVKGVSEEE